MTFLRSIARLYATSWILLLTHSLCIVIGAAWAFAAIVLVLRTEGILP